jgi:hypothetical protein
VCVGEGGGLLCVYDANSLDALVTCPHAPESKIQFNQYICVAIDVFT